MNKEIKSKDYRDKNIDQMSQDELKHALRKYAEAETKEPGSADEKAARKENLRASRLSGRIGKIESQLGGRGLLDR